MITPVSFELAKLLKEKGFDNITNLIYMTNHSTEVLFENINKLKHSDGNNPFCSAPTIAEVVMWLYEKHGIWVQSMLYRRNPNDFIAGVYHNKSDTYFTQPYNSPTEAYEAAIKYTLNNLI